MDDSYEAICKPMIRVSNLCFSYGRQRILDALDFSAAAGECVVFAGPNGSGKSTALALTAGILQPTAGEIRTAGRIGYVPQGTALLEDATVEENLRFFADIARVCVPALLPFSVERYKKKKVSALSGGMKKQVSIACAMIGDPQILLLDEPCSALDIAFRAEMTELVLKWKSENRTVLYVGHEPAEIFAFADRMLFFGEKNEMFDRREAPAFWQDEKVFAENYKKLFENVKRK